MLTRLRYILPMRLRTLFQRNRTENEMNEELAFHLEMQKEELIAKGVSAEDAKLAARKSFGNLSVHQEEYRDARGFQWLESLMQDARQSFTTLRRTPGFTAVAVLSLALSIGAAATVFSIVDVGLLNPLPFANAERMVWLQEFGADHKTYNGNPARLKDWQRSQSFAAVAGFYGEGLVLTGEGDPIRVNTVRTYGPIFDVLSVPNRLGRGFTPAESEGEGAPVALLSESFWQKRFHADSNIVGRTLRLGGSAYQVVGVLGAVAKYPEQIDVWTPGPSAYQTPRQAGFLDQVAILRPGVPLKSAQAELNTIGAQLAKQYPDTDRGRSVQLIPLAEQVARNSRTALLLFFSIVIAILLIVCLNVASLLLARGMSRSREAAIRVALGAGRGRVFRLFLMESFLIAIASAALGLGLAALGLDTIKALLPNEIPRLAEASISFRVVLATLGFAVLAALVSGTLPAWQAATRAVSSVLKEGGRGSIGTSRQWLRSALVTAEIALSFVLVVTAGLIANSFLHLNETPLGFNPQNAYSFGVNFPWDTDDKIFHQFAGQALDRLKTIPGVTSAAVVDQLPLHGGSQSGPIVVRNLSLTPAQAVEQISWRTASPDYFTAVGVPLISGNVFRNYAGKESPLEAVISQRLATTVFPEGNAIGREIARQPRGKNQVAQYYRITGIVGDVRHDSTDAVPPMEIYVPLGTTYWPQLKFVVRTSMPQSEFARTARANIQPLLTNQIIEKLGPLTEQTAETKTAPRMRALLITGFALLALALSSIGLFGLLSYEIARRAPEFGLRIALGAQPSQIAKTALWHGLIPSLSGLALGIPLALLLSQTLQSMLYSVQPNDPRTYIVAAVLAIVTSLLACLIPTGRAMRVNPISVLRQE